MRKSGPGERDGFAADDAHAELPRGFAQAGVERLASRDVGVAGGAASVMSACAGTPPIAAMSLIARQSAFQPTRRGSSSGEKMHAFDDDIRLQQLPARVARAADDRAIVARADAHVRAEREAARELGDEPVFAEIGERRAASARFTARGETGNRACT